MWDIDECTLKKILIIGGSAAVAGGGGFYVKQIMGALLGAVGGGIIGYFLAPDCTASGASEGRAVAPSYQRPQIRVTSPALKLPSSFSLAECGPGRPCPPGSECSHGRCVMAVR